MSATEIMTGQETERIPNATKGPVSDPAAVAIAMEPLGNATENGDGERAADGGVKQYPSGIKLFSITLSLVMVLLLAGLDGNIVATAVPSITYHFHTVADV